MTHVTRDQIIHVTRARVTAISRFPVTCVTSGIARGPDEVCSPANVVTKKPLRRPAQTFHRLLREKTNRSTGANAAGVTQLLTVTALDNPRRFPTISNSTAHRGKVVRRQHVASFSSGFSLCCGHIGRVLRARSTNNLRKLDEKGRERARARGPSQAAAAPILPLPWWKTGPGCRGGRKSRSFTQVYLIRPARGSVRKFWAAPCKNIVQHCGALLTR